MGEHECSYSGHINSRTSFYSVFVPQSFFSLFSRFFPPGLILPLKDICLTINRVKELMDADREYLVSMGV